MTEMEMQSTFNSRNVGNTLKWYSERNCYCVAEGTNSRIRTDRRQAIYLPPSTEGKQGTVRYNTNKVSLCTWVLSSDKRRNPREQLVLLHILLSPQRSKTPRHHGQTYALPIYLLHKCLRKQRPVQSCQLVDPYFSFYRSAVREEAAPFEVFCCAPDVEGDPQFEAI
ncbi:hypothetical protein K402DRAFT_73002 [Aulographum hederae CBS 113979]|uniref:Uncharacterized protein n=1 Tax=Aulographum hederae CBS 113979 TaxID=1176131 RepID=A0A6G1HFR5_9PEZI|nr:hypothetical protein K402DRAFT_73002 [Aulographum hederae CBS 113979]